MKYTVFASTCSSAAVLDEVRRYCYALDFEYPISGPLNVEAKSLIEAIEKYRKTNEYLSFFKEKIYFYYFNEYGKIEMVK